MTFTVRVSDHVIELDGVVWRGRPAPHEHLLVLRGVGLRAWISHGPISVTVQCRDERPDAAELAEWDDVVGGSARLELGATVHGADEFPPPEAVLCPRAGLYGVVVGAAGRLEHYDAAVDESDERYLVATWPIDREVDGEDWWIRSRRAQRFGSVPPSLALPLSRGLEPDAPRTRFLPGPAEPGPVRPSEP